MIRTRAFAWIACLQFFLVQVIVGLAWRTHFDLWNFYISDLGALRCGVTMPSGHYVCSPWHIAMNASMIFQGVLISTGATYLLTARERREPFARICFGLLLAAALGSALVGFFPEDSLASIHYAGAAVHIVCANAGLLLLGAAGVLPRGLAPYARIAGGVGLLAATALVSGHFRSLGPGAWERIAIYPFPIMLASIGAALRPRVRDTREFS